MMFHVKHRRLGQVAVLLVAAMVFAGCQIADAPDGWGAVAEDPEVAGRVVFPTGGDFVAAVDLESGVVAWRFPKIDDDRRMAGLPADLDASAFYADPVWADLTGEWIIGEYSSGVLYAVRGDGSSARAVYSTGARIVATPIVDGNLAYIATNDDRIVAVDLERPEIAVWEWSGGTDRAILGAPALADTDDGRVLVFASLDGWVTALRVDGASAGESAWRREIGTGLASAISVGESLAYFGGFDRTFYALHASSGETVWRQDGRHWFWSTPLVADGSVYATDVRGNVYAWDAATGSPRWPSPFDPAEDERVRSQPVLTEVDGVPILVVIAHNGQVHQINAATGTSAFPFRIEIEGNVLSDAKLIDGRILVGNEDGDLWAATAGVNAAPVKIYDGG